MSRRAIVVHEEEHRSAGDPALLLAGLVAVVLMPWNVGFWLSWTRMRRAVELDCDTRVLARGVEPAEYANVLLSAWRMAHRSWLPSPAFAEQASGLGLRVEHLMRREPRRRGVRTLVGLAIASALVVVACKTPNPERSAKTEMTTPLLVIDGVKRPDLPPPSTADTSKRGLYPDPSEIALYQKLDSTDATAQFGEQGRLGAVLLYTKKYRAAGGRIIAPTKGGMAERKADPSTPAEEMERRIYDRMFKGITLDAGQEAKAREIVDQAYTDQHALQGPAILTWPKLVALEAKRDTALRALLRSDGDRAIFDVHSVEGRARGNITREGVEGSVFGNLFRGITLSAAQAATAHRIIMKSVDDEVALYPTLPSGSAERLALADKRDVDLRALLTFAAEKAEFDKRATLQRSFMTRQR